MSFTKLMFISISIFCSALLVSGCERTPAPDTPAGGASSPTISLPTMTPATTEQRPTLAPETAASEAFEYKADRFADKRILRYRVPGFDNLDLKTKTLLYYLSEAALSGRDIMWDQNNRYNLRIRLVIDTLMRHYSGDRETQAFKAFEIYAKEIWFASGIHHHYSNAKFQPGFTFQDLSTWANTVDAVYWALPEGQSPTSLLAQVRDVMFDPTVAAKKISRAADVDNVVASAVNFYEGVTEAEVTTFYQTKAKNDSATPVSHGLNSKLLKEDGKIVEKVWKVDGMYGEAIEKIVFWLEKAISVAENDKQKHALELLVKYYRSGDLADFDAYSIAWVKDTESAVDVINGFIEVYNDPLGYRGSFESIVAVRDVEASRRISAIAKHAQWFEDHSPIMDDHKKSDVTGITGKVINVVMEAGDASPATPIGINLPNSNWIRANHGSKSVSLGNIVAAYNAATGESLKEFAYSSEEIAMAERYGETAGFLRTDMHEVIGHASGKLNPGVATPKETLKQYASALEEARADLVALYFMPDQKLVDIGVMPSLDFGIVEYNRYMRSGLMTQLFRVKEGENLEQAHMQNRQMVAQWAYEKGKPNNVVELKKRDGKTYVVINDYAQLRILFGELLRELQRIKSEGDFAAAQALIEQYGVKVNAQLHQEVLQRFATLDIAPFSGFINPKLVATFRNDVITDITLEYPKDFSAQMLEYSANYGFLPLVN